ncbi:MAG: Lrp/AsnC family transcriptional regulator [Pseudomonadota bacterium]
MIKLTDKDKLVFYALTKWPQLNDIQLSQKIGIKRSTIAAIRNKLEKNKLYNTINVPDLERIGCELLTVRYGSFNPLCTYLMREKYSSTYKFPEVFFKRSTDRQRIALNAAKNFTEVKEYIDYSNRIYGEQGFLTDEGIVHVFFPFKISRISSFFDYVPLLKQHFNLDIESERVVLDNDLKEHRPADLTEKEKLLLYALVKYPQLNDNELSQKVSITRQSVSSIRKRLEEDGLVKTINVPNLTALGLQVMAFTHVLVNPKSTLNMRKHGILKILSQGVHIFHISGNLEFVLISHFKDYPEYARSFEEIVSYYKEHDLLLKEPITRIFLNEDIKLAIDGRFAPLVKEIFDIKNDI